MTKETRTPQPIWLATIGIVLGFVFAIAAYSLGRALRPPQVLQGAMLNPPVPAVDFRLQGPDGMNFSLYDFRDKPVLLAFSCSYCSANSELLSKLAQVRHIAIENGFDCQSVIISIDPERDTPKQISEFVQSFDESFIGLSGDHQQISDLAHSYDIYFNSSHTNEADDPQLEVTPLIMLIDRQGHWRAVYPLRMSAEDIARDIQILLEES